MGSTFFGSDAKQTGSVNLLTPQQQSFINNNLQQLGPQVTGALQTALQGFNPDQLNQFYQQGLVNPTLQTFNEQVIPSIQQRFVDNNAGSSSALNQALAKSATDLSSGLSGQLSGLLYQGQQQAGSNQAQAINQILAMLGQNQFQPIVSGPQPGILQNLISAGTGVGASWLGNPLGRGY